MNLDAKAFGAELKIATVVPESFNLQPGECKVFVQRTFTGTRLLIVRMDASGRIRAVYRKPRKVQ